MASAFAHIFSEKRVLLCVGSGGVGKTTTAALFALRGALRGHKTLVLTIDPAKRLANSLGLSELDHQVQRVADPLLNNVARLGGIPVQPGGELYAMMLDQKHAFDDIVDQHVSSPETAQRILQNPVYKQISGTLAGSQEYAAMARLHDFVQSGDYDLIVVDTPPTAHALDFLDAPKKLSEAIDSPVIDWFRKIANGGAGSWSIAGRTGAYVLKRLSTFVGSRFIHDIAAFLTEFNDILGGFRQRAEQVFATLRQNNVGFILVASPEPAALREARYFFTRLSTSSLPFSGFVMNRVHRDFPLEVNTKEVLELLKESAPLTSLNLSPQSLQMAATALIDNHGALQELARADAQSVTELRKLSPRLAQVPFLDHDIHSLAALATLSRYIFDP